MNFDFSDDQKLLRKTARDFLSEHAPLSLCRAVLESDAAYSDTLWKSIAELGWLGTAIPEEYGGAGFGHLELAALAEELGRALAPIPFSSSVYLAAEAILFAGSRAQKHAYLPQLAAGAWIGTFAHAEKPGEAGPGTIASTFANGTLTGVKVPVADGDAAHCAVVTATQGKDIVLLLVDLNARGVTRQPLRSIDPSRSLAALRFDATPAQLLGDGATGAGASGATASGAAALQKLMDRAAVLLAFEQIGGATRAFEITREYCLSRYAFGRPIASFQAIKHRLADLYVELELARSNAYFGAWGLSTDSPELPVAACGARASASDAFELASQEMIQLHGGVGYTWEFDCHLFYRRAKYLGALLGSAHEWREQLVQRLAAAEQ